MTVTFLPSTNRWSSSIKALGGLFSIKKMDLIIAQPVACVHILMLNLDHDSDVNLFCDGALHSPIIPVLSAIMMSASHFNHRTVVFVLCATCFPFLTFSFSLPSFPFAICCCVSETILSRSFFALLPLLH